MDAFALADPFLSYETDRGETLCLSDSVQDMSAYLQVTDDVKAKILDLKPIAFPLNQRCEFFFCCAIKICHKNSAIILIKRNNWVIIYYDGILEKMKNYCP